MDPRELKSRYEETLMDLRLPSLKISLKKGRSRLRWASELMLPGRHEWDVQILKSYLNPHGVQGVKFAYLKGLQRT
jgi:hypothetical protein